MCIRDSLSLEGNDPAARVNEIPNDVNNPPAAEGYFLVRQQIIYNTAHFDPYIPDDGGGAVSYSSYMHGEGFCKGSESNAAINIAAPDRSANGPDALLHIRMTSANYTSHSFSFYWNEQLLVTALLNN